MSIRLNLIPRPLILKALQRYHKMSGYLSGTPRDGSKLSLLSFALGKLDINGVEMAALDADNSLATITPEQANILSRPGFACSNTRTNYHELRCGHIVLTTATWPSVTLPKSACASNCAKEQPVAIIASMDPVESRYVPGRQATFAPFICPSCIEIMLHRNYIKIWKEYRAAGFPPAPEPSVNVEVWMYSSIRVLRRAGLRVSQGTSGSFLLEHESRHEHVDFVPSVVERILAQWTFRGRKASAELRRRSRSPRRFIDQESGLPTVRRDDLDACIRGTDKRRYRDRGSMQDTNESWLKDLVERLGDARLGLLEDSDVDELIAGIGCLGSELSRK